MGGQNEQTPERTPALSDRATLLCPVASRPLGLAAAVTVDGTAFVAKAEHHITVFGASVGRLLLAAFKDDPALRGRIDARTRAMGWSWRRRGLWYRLARDEPKPLTTIIELVEAPIARFYAAVAGDVDAARFPELAAVLASPPPPHVTLYTSDPAGAAGIGLHRAADLDEALERARTAAPGEPRLRAYALAGPPVDGAT